MKMNNKITNAMHFRCCQQQTNLELGV